MANPFFDTWMPLFRNPYFWTPVYLFLLIWMWKKYNKVGLLWCLFFLITFALCDFISASIIKNEVQRIRPCNDESLQFLIRKIVKCGAGYSFPSSHATNHFGLSFFIIFTLGKKYKHAIWLALFWAILVCFAQVYVGVHYPLDIFGGALLGICLAYITGTLFNRKVRLNESQ